MLTLQEVSEWLGVAPDTVKKWFGMGLKGYKINKVIQNPGKRTLEVLRSPLRTTEVGDTAWKAFRPASRR